LEIGEVQAAALTLGIEVGTFESGDIGNADRRAKQSLQESSHHVRVEDDRAADARQLHRWVLDGVGPIQRHGEKEAQCHDRKVDGQPTKLRCP
jgi:hypothetical protein